MDEDASDAGERPITDPAADSGEAGTDLDSGSPDRGDAGSDADADAQLPSTGDGCDRACLLQIMQGYLGALIARDPSKLTVSSSLKYTENGKISTLGDTLWKTASSLMPDARLDFADPLQGQVATQTVINENGSTPVIYSARLKVVSREITEIETIAVRRGDAANGFFSPSDMVPEPMFLEAVDPEKRMSRDALNALTEQYLDYLEGKRRGGEVAFDEGCKRYENGQVTASGLFSFNLQSWSFEVTRRTLIIDEEAGITWGMYPFYPEDETLVVGEAFKLIDGKIMMIQAVMANMPAKAWD